jgi:hypothetical protein
MKIFLDMVLRKNPIVKKKERSSLCGILMGNVYLRYHPDLFRGL